jgi:hypothetical protein
MNVNLISTILLKKLKLKSTINTYYIRNNSKFTEILHCFHAEFTHMSMIYEYNLTVLLQFLKIVPN